ncbi:MAG: alpha/beta fold hydrolase [Chloroflexaceae bacterium]|nr:alpha/beta fold hydrolase [Chloroflexaceae bacterium]
MSALYLDNRLVHYEVFGRGQPVIFLHSWVGSWRYWVSTMDQVSVRYRTYALDFWGFGESERNYQDLGITTFVQMLHGFMDDMGIRKANLVGHGLGGMVAVRAAQTSPERFTRLLLVATPLEGAILGGLTRRGTFSRLLGSSNPSTTWTKLIRQIPVDDSEVQQELYEDTDSLSEQVISSVQKSIMETDLRSSLRELDESIPVLAVYGEKDSIIPPDHAQTYPFLRDDRPYEEGHPPHQLVLFPGANHFPFLEDSTAFSRMVLDFMMSKKEDLPIAIKEHWRRRVSQHEYL